MPTGVTPTYNGLAIFGRDVRMTVTDQPPARQERGYPGLNGVVSLALGGRGRYLMAGGNLYSVSVGGYDALEDLWRGYRDGLAYPLVSTLGRLWPYAILEEFNPDQGPLRPPGHFGYWKPYQMRFRLLQ